MEQLIFLFLFLCVLTQCMVSLHLLVVIACIDCCTLHQTLPLFLPWICHYSSATMSAHIKKPSFSNLSRGLLFMFTIVQLSIYDCLFSSFLTLKEFDCHFVVFWSCINSYFTLRTVLFIPVCLISLAVLWYKVTPGSLD